MIRSASKAVAIAATFILAAIGASAQTAAPTKLKPKPNAAAGPTISVTVVNKRDVGLTELDLAPSGVPTFKPFVKKLAAGKSTVVTLPRDENCVFDFYVKYDNGETNSVAGYNVCTDGRINLVE
jgi:hypothetical protein